MKKKVCIFCGSRDGANIEWVNRAQTLGTELAKRAWPLVYGGSNSGLMGAVARGTLEAGGVAIGIMPENLTNEEQVHPNLTEIHFVKSIRERKDMMSEISDAFVTIPGGIGTMEEFFELWTAKHVGYHDKPVILVNWDGYFDPLIEFISSSHQDGFITDSHLKKIVIVNTIDEIFSALEK
jgi:hypothetical protein